MRLLLVVIVMLGACRLGPGGDKAVVDEDGDGFDETQDCNDGDAEVHPGATEVCDGLDNDCVGGADNAVAGAPTWYADIDGDGFGLNAVGTACTAPDGTVAEAGDCDDSNPDRNPGATEVCDDHQIDEDCDNVADDEDDSVTGRITYFRDKDRDGHGDLDNSVQACAVPEGGVEEGDDCNDNDPAVYPGAPEPDCGGTVDANCDGSVGLDDADGDTYTACEDCDDRDPTVHPGAIEVCDAADVDENCNGVADEDDATADVSGGALYHPDTDGDGWGSATVSERACAAPDGWVTDGTDCDDTSDAMYPGNTESCDGLDNNCDGDIDEGAEDLQTWFLDADEDGYGDAASGLGACSPPPGYVADASDCNDANTTIHPDAPETDCADPTDYNCDGSVGAADNDLDGASACEDCDDADPTRSPGAPEVCDELGRDEDCDTLVNDADPSRDPSTGIVLYRDADGDGQGDITVTELACATAIGFVANAYDCDDSDGSTFLGALEACDGVDNNCDGTTDESALDQPSWYADIDGDGYGTPSDVALGCGAPDGYVADSDDCDDADPEVHPEALENCADEIDYNCDGSVGEADADGDGWSACTECDDSDPDRHPAAVEVCDSERVDENCDGLVNDEDPGVNLTTGTNFYLDIDGDGHGDSFLAITACTVPEGYTVAPDDCDDTNPAAFPGNTEVCDSADNNCDGAVDEGGVQADWYPDVDGDLHGDLTGGVTTCPAPAGYVADAADCDDTRSDVYPGAAERCDGFDEDCDGVIDEAAVDASIWHRDGDGDGYGDAATAQAVCDAPEGYVADGTDCDDIAADIHPTRVEVCDGLDNDCDGYHDDDDLDLDPTSRTRWYVDDDEDGYGSPTVSAETCVAPEGYVERGLDCDDARPEINPDAAEICDPANDDEDCDTYADEADPSVAGTSVWYLDDDDDGYGASAPSQVLCDQPVGYAAQNSDCNDGDGGINPGATEICDDGDTDEDCNGLADDSAASGQSTWYRDQDGDTWGDARQASSNCDQPTGYVAVLGDCDDTTSAVTTGSPEVCDPANVDEDCDALADNDDPDAASDLKVIYYVDADGDAHGTPDQYSAFCDLPTGYSASLDDCDDTRADTYTGSIERCDVDNIDEDCDGAADDLDVEGATETTTHYDDGDGDGVGAPTAATHLQCDDGGGYVAGNTDCDDTNAAVHPGADEVCDSTGTDEDCDGLVDDDDDSLVDPEPWYVDADGDGHGDPSLPVAACLEAEGTVDNSDDCNDASSSAHPGGTEVCDPDDLDEDCDGVADDVTALDQSTWYIDGDGDAWGTMNLTLMACNQPEGYGMYVADCDDTRADVNPDASEICDEAGTDEDCDGLANDADTLGDAVVNTLPWYADPDEDGYGSEEYVVHLCVQPGDTIGAGGDCDDTDPALNPEGIEVCLDNIDQNCDGEPDDGCHWDGDNLVDDVYDTLLYGEAYADLFGRTLAGDVDLNGDGHGDLIVGAYRNDYAGLSYGSTYVYYGPLDAGVYQADTLADGRYYGTSSSEGQSGRAVVGVNDLNNDGKDELAIFGNAGTTLYLIPGPANAVESVADAAAGTYSCDAVGSGGATTSRIGHVSWLCGNSESGERAGKVTVYDGFNVVMGTIYGEALGDEAGQNVVGGGDVTGDGLADIWIGAHSESTNGTDAGAAYLMVAPYALSESLRSADAKILGANSSDNFGQGLEMPGDANDDGYDDILMGAEGLDTYARNAGAVYLFTSGYGSGVTPDIASAVVYGNEENALLGYYGMSAGDIDNDGEIDLLLSSQTYTGTARSVGAAWVIYGPISGTYQLGEGEYHAQFYGPNSSDYVGASAVIADDLNGDGGDDIVIGSMYGDHDAADPNLGAAWIFNGR